MGTKHTSGTLHGHMVCDMYVSATNHPQIGLDRHWWDKPPSLLSQFRDIGGIGMPSFRRYSHQSYKMAISFEINVGHGSGPVNSNGGI